MQKKFGPRRAPRRGTDIFLRDIAIFINFTKFFHYFWPAESKNQIYFQQKLLEVAIFSLKKKT